MARNKEFDELTALHTAMLIFWRNGYEKTSMKNLVDGMNIHRRSIYGTFGNKKTLFLRALQLFEDITEKYIKRQVMTIQPAKSAIRELLEMPLLTHEDKPPGCLIVNTAVELTIHDKEISESINQSYRKTEELIEKILTQGHERGEIPNQHDIKSLAQFIHNAFIGIRVLVKSTHDRKKLQGIIDTTLSIFD